MVETMDGSSRLFDPLLDLLDRVLAALGRVGIELPVLITQLFLLVLILAALYPVARATLRRDKLALTAPSAAALVLAVIGLGFGIVDQARLPSYVAGVVVAPHFDTVRVQLLDHQGRILTSGDGRVDTHTGEFALFYQPWLEGRAHVLAISGCTNGELRFPLPRAHVRAGADSRRTYACPS